MSSKTAVFIPVRMASTRLPGKPLALIAGKEMILHVIDRVREAKVGDIHVACCEAEVHKVVTDYGVNAVMTDPDHPSGTDRIYEAFMKVGGSYQQIINVQGDLPTVDPKLIRICLDTLDTSPEADIATLAAKIKVQEERSSPHVVKPVISFYKGHELGRALYFTRATAPSGEGALYHHIGMYGYRIEALKRFVSLSPSALEKREKLEQLRALEHNMRIDVAIVDTVPLGVDTPEDLKKAEQLMAA